MACILNARAVASYAFAAFLILQKVSLLLDKKMSAFCEGLGFPPKNRLEFSDEASVDSSVMKKLRDYFVACSHV